MTGEKFMLEEEKEVTFIVIFSGTSQVARFLSSA